MRRLFALTALVASLLALAPSAGAGTLFVLTGRGWGHAVGMSQWGAFGMAQDGSTYVEILTHYYTGTSVAAHSNPVVGVQLASGRTSLVVGSDASFRVSAGTRTATHGPGNATVTKTSTGAIKVQGITGTFASPATFTATAPSTDPLRLGSAHYRGTLVVSVQGGLRVVNRLRLDSYVQGVVPRESPSWWPAAALRAQAVAARSYALYALLHGGGKCGGAFCPDTRDQVYGGLDGEAASTNAATEATAGQVVLDGGGNVAQTFFYSSSGGRTADSADVWGGTVSYLKSVADPKDLVPENPNRFWRVLRTAGQFRSQLALARLPNDATVTRNSSDRVASIRASGPGWATVVEGGDSLRWRLGIKSNRFWLGVLRLTPARTRIIWGERVALDTFVRGVANVSLQRRPYAQAWQAVAPVSGSQTFRPAPRISTFFRLTSPAATGQQVQILVAPRINFLAASAQTARALKGVVRPKTLAGKTVTVQRRVSGVWRKVASAVVAADGTFTARFTVRSGAYRARIAPGNGFVPGTSPTLTVAVR
jgi:stage II sporulation protein D